MIQSNKLRISVFVVLILGYAAFMLGLPLFGATIYKLKLYFSGSGDSLDAFVLWKMRVPRVILAYCAGGILALGGMVFQSMFRNPLATPFTLGISSGCSFGAAVYLVLFSRFGLQSVAGIDPISFFAFSGGTVASMFIFSLTRIKKAFHTDYMLLAGIAVTLFFSSMVLIIQYVSNFHQTFLIFRWLIGGLESVSYLTLLKMVPFAVGILAVILLYSGELDIMLTGDEIATSKGVDVTRLKLFMFVLVSFMISYVVSICGPIAFIDMIIPNICRMILGPRHNMLALASFLSGGVFLAVCDAVARSVMSPSELPVGIITAFLGGIFFIWLLLRHAKSYGS